MRTSLTAPSLVLLSLLAACGETKQQAPAGEAKPAAEERAAEEPAAEGAATAEGWSWDLPEGLEAPPVPEDNPMSAAKVELGHALFMDKRLSVDGSRSCYSCHQNELGNADGRAKALGPGDQVLARNTPTIWNVAYHRELYWDGRAPSLEKQAIGAWKGGNMAVGADNLAAKAKEIGELPEYRPQFEAVFGLAADAAVEPDHVAKALSAYERTLLCGATPYDTQKLDEAQQRGWDLFRGKAGCGTCHNGPNFTDGLYHNAGIGFDAEGKPLEDVDVGRGKITGAEQDNHKLRTPTLRNVSKTAPYFHDGSVATLEEAVRYMANGANPKAPGLDPSLVDKGLDDEEVADIVAFLGALECAGSLEVIGDQAVAGITAPPTASDD